MRQKCLSKGGVKSLCLSGLCWVAWAQKHACPLARVAAAVRREGLGLCTGQQHSVSRNCCPFVQGEP